MVQGRRPRRPPLRRVLWGGAEVAVTLGVVLLLLVVHQLWWTNRQARAGAERKVHALEREWEGGGGGGGGDEGGRGAADASPGDDGAVPDDDPAVGDDTPSGSSTSSGSSRASGGRGGAAQPRWDQAYAILDVPRLGLRAPVAQGISKAKVLNRGYVGHYPGTAQPGRAGNFALAGHRNTHGEPFRYINRLRRGDTLTVRTEEATYTYVVDKKVAQTSAGDGGVIGAVPRSRVVPSAGYSEPGYYITLTTCTPEFTSKYRLVVWGKLSRMTPR
ncbi:class E sortase [Streptomyces kunmingensis]|uniref:Class E sortase n=1 Tax=Streptomyces kunmingensis TaxID=68225 RepID=A0ABU6CCX4_9ACTN|nr:class E sortase [Streptomyces kunmingensis]MEB3962573.1 class E sortase [Streptomyces kunmingensis]